ncbi:MAG TPA: NAD(P)H-binding protein [Thermoanaerobaculia bacterium]|nr:NAD(P)H-binding protein [Thermoanaerobaculia bacterium]
MPGTILVVGGTGMLGMPVARQLQADGFAVRVYTRDADKVRRQLGGAFAAAPGNVADIAALDRAVAGCSGVHINLRGRPVGENTFERAERLGVDNVLAAAARAGVERLTYLSDLHALAAENHELPQIAVKVASEAAIRASGLSYAIFRATVFMDSLSHSSRQGRLVAPLVHSRYHLLAAGDYARLVSRFYQSASAPNRELAVYGPQAVDFHDAVRRYCAAAHPGKRVYSLPVWAASLAGSLTRNAFTRTTAKVLRMYQSGEPGDPARSDSSLGTPTTTFDDWLRQLRREAPKAA